MNIKFYFDKKKCREGINYKDYAAKMGITLETFSKIIHGQRVPQPRIAKKFEEATNGEIRAEQVLMFCLHLKNERIKTKMRALKEEARQEKSKLITPCTPLAQT